MTDTTPRAGAPLLGAAQAQKHITHNEALYQFDALLCARFLDRDLSAPPSSPADGDAYLVKATGSGAWAGQGGKIAYSADGVWRFYTPFAGLVAYVSDEAASIVYDGTSWSAYGAAGLTAAPMMGINATADSTNKLSVKSNAVLLADVAAADGGTGDTRLVLSKEGASNTASLLYQDAFSGRAEIGLCGDDDFHFKVSSNGSTWREALKLRGASGVVSLPLGQLQFPATQNASSDANTLDDYEEGTWTPVDSSGAGLTLSAITGCTYTKIGRHVTLIGQWTYPSTANATPAQIGGAPFANAGGAAVGNYIGSVGGSGVTFFGNGGVAMTFIVIATNGNVLNSGFSGGVIRITGVYNAAT